MRALQTENFVSFQSSVDEITGRTRTRTLPNFFDRPYPHLPKRIASPPLIKKKRSNSNKTKGEQLM